MYFGPRSCHFSGSQHNLWSLQVFGGQERQSDGGVQHSVQRRRRRHHRQSLHAGVCEATFTDFYCLCLAPFPFVPTLIDSTWMDVEGRIYVLLWSVCGYLSDLNTAFCFLFFFYTHFLCCWVSKKAVLILTSQSVAWVWWWHILVPVWNLCRADILKVPGSKWMENPENSSELCRVDPSRF